MKISDLSGRFREAAEQQTGKSHQVTDCVTLTLPMPPAINSLYATVRGRRVLSKAGRDYKLAVASIVAERPAELFTGPVAVAVKIFRPRKAGDLDGYLKSLFDSLTGQVLKDDSQVTEIHATRFEDKDRPRVEIEVRPASHHRIGVDQEQCTRQRCR